MKPTVFVGSSTGSLDVAKAIEQNLAAVAEVTVWPRAFFLPGDGTLDTLLTNLPFFDFAVFAISPVDVLSMEDKKAFSTRSNVILELGLFIGMHGERRAFLIVPHDYLRHPDLPSDLGGITYLGFDSRDANRVPALGPACNQIEDAIRTRGLAPGFHIVNKASGKCLDVHDWSTEEEANIIQFGFHGGDNQIWHLRPLDRKHFVILSKYSLKCLDVKGAAVASGAPVKQFTYGGGANQQWYFTDQSDGTYWIRPRHSRKCVGVKDGRLDNGAPIVQHNPGEYEHLKWWLKKAVSIKTI